MKALVVGATGETGRRIVQQLTVKNIPVRALVRDPVRAREILPASAEVVVGDVLEPATLERAIADCTVVFCATGASPSLNPLGPYQVDYEGTKNLVDVQRGTNRTLCDGVFFVHIATVPSAEFILAHLSLETAGRAVPPKQRINLYHCASGWAKKYRRAPSIGDV
jgi:uncharacterized protein YbjT (DUF2867 family)